MAKRIGEEGTEQFTVTTWVDGKKIGEQSIHDPFLHTTVKHKLSRWDHLKQVFAPKTIKVQVGVDGTHGVMRAIMALDVDQLQQASAEWLREMACARECNAAEGVVGHYKESVD